MCKWVVLNKNVFFLLRDSVSISPFLTTGINIVDHPTRQRGRHKQHSIPFTPSKEFSQYSEMFDSTHPPTRPLIYELNKIKSEAEISSDSRAPKNIHPS